MYVGHWNSVDMDLQGIDGARLHFAKCIGDHNWIFNILLIGSFVYDSVFANHLRETKLPVVGYLGCRDVVAESRILQFLPEIDAQFAPFF